jgi:hypothetical protein
MAITRLSLSSILNSPKYDSILANQQSLPSVPTIGTATDGGTGTTVSVAFTAGGIAGSNYTALSTPGSITATGTSSPITVSGLTSGTAYTFQVRATNNVGNSAYSAASNSVTPVVPFVATGGSTITSGGFKYHVFTSNGTFAVSAGSTSQGEVIRIAGGGTGQGGSFGGGGGAGGLAYTSATTFTVGNYTVVVGGAGSNTTFTGLANAIAGGAGGAGGSNGSSGGSGGGAGGSLSGSRTGGAATAGQGFAGGDTNPSAGAGGGGSGAVGGSTSGGSSGIGGDGTNSYSTWLSAISSLMAAGWQTATSGGRIAGGGGGRSAGAGGAGGGGTASAGGGTGVTNTGSGGAGPSSGSTSGGSGIVIVRYPV